MKILHLNTLSEGGAAMALKRIHRGLLSHGVDSRVLSLYRLPENESIPNWFSILDLESGLIKTIIRSVKYRSQKWTDPFHEYSSPLSIFRPETSDLVEWADVINLHWIASFVNYPTFFNHPNVLKKPIVWRTPDLFPMRGIAHYDGDIKKENKLLEKSAVELKTKSLSHHKNIYVVATSNWTKQEALQSGVFTKVNSIQLIHNALDPKKFENITKEKARGTYKQLLFIAANLSNKTKGFNQFLEILKGIEMEGWELVVVGSGLAPEISTSIPIKYLGTLSSEEEMVKIYHRADIYISAANEEAFGQTVIEAMLCAKPVVAIGVGGILDTVIHGETGFLAELGDLDGFREQLTSLMKDEKLRIEFGRKGKERAEKYFSSEAQIEKYIQLYQKILLEKY